MKRLPVTILSGFLGAGKTTILGCLLNDSNGLKVAVIVNDMSEINIDGQFIANGGKISRTEESLIELSNGCICCSLREDLVKEVEVLVRANRFDYIIIESTGIAEPLIIAQTFSIADKERNIDLSHFAHIDTLVTVVDAYNFYHQLNEIEESIIIVPTTSKATPQLLVEQIEFANVIVLNKIDLVDREALLQIHTALERMNPQARVIEAVFGEVPLETLCFTGSYHGDSIRKHPKWALELNSHRHSSEEYGIRSFSFFERRPFHPQRLWDYLHKQWNKRVIRSKGLFWIASRPNLAIRWSQAGAVKSLQPERPWWGSMPESERIHYEEYLFNKPFIRSRWDEHYKDRMTELVFIGSGLKEDWMRMDLGACICTEEEVEAMKRGEVFNDPFPLWEESQANNEGFKYLEQFFNLQ